MSAKTQLTREELEEFFVSDGQVHFRRAAEHFGCSSQTISRIWGMPNSPSKPDRTTATDRAIYDAIVTYIDEHGWAPSISDISEATGISRSAIHLGLARLQFDGRIVTGGGPRMIKVLR